MLLVGLALQVTVRDSLPILSIVYYGLPHRVLCTLAFVSGCVAVALRRRRTALALLGILAAALALDFTRGSGKIDAPGTSPTVAFGNAWNGREGVPAILDALLDPEPELAAIVEAGKETDYAEEARRRGYHSFRLPGGLVVFSRHAIQDEGSRYVKDRVGAGVVSTGPWKLMVVDVSPGPWKHRPPSLDAVHEWIRQYDPDIVVGDFNTPLASRGFRGILQSYDSGSNEYGDRESWPQPLPVLDLDHVLVRKSFRTIGYTIDPNDVSDHRFVRAWIEREP